MKKTLVLIMVTVYLASCTSDSKKANSHFTEASNYLEKKDFGKASKEIDMAFQLDSSNYDIQILKAKIKAETENYEEAIQILKTVLNKKFKQDTVNYLIGDCYYQLGTYYRTQKNDESKEVESLNNSLKFLETALSLNSQYFEAYIVKQRILHNLKRYDDALITLNNAIQFFPDSVILIYSRGVEKHYLGDNIGAMNDLDKSIKSKTLDSVNLALAYRFRAYIYYDKDSIDKAIDDLTNAIKFNPNDDYAYASRANYYREKGNKDKACEDYRKAADLGFVAIYEIIKEYCAK